MINLSRAVQNIFKTLDSLLRHWHFSHLFLINFSKDTILMSCMIERVIKTP